MKLYMSLYCHNVVLILWVGLHTKNTFLELGKHHLSA